MYYNLLYSKFFVLYLMLCLFSFSASAQTYTTIEEFETVLQQTKENTYNSGEYDAGIRFLKNNLLPQAKQQFDEQHIIIADILYRIGIFYYKKRAFTETVAYLKDALSIRKNKPSNCDANISKLYCILGECHQTLNSIKLAINYFKSAIEVRSSCQNQRLWSAHLSLANLYDDIGEFALADEQYKKAIEHSIDDNKVDCYYYRALSKSGRKLNQEALNDLTIVQKFYEEANETLFPEWYLVMGGVEENLKNFDAAIANYKVLEKIYNDDEFDNQYELSYLYNNMGITYRKQKKYEQAIATLEKAFAFAKQYYETDKHLEYLAIYDNLGDCFYDQNLYEDALEYYNLAEEQIANVEGLGTGTTLEKIELQLLVVLNAKIKTYKKLFQKTKNKTYTKKAVDYSMQAIDLIDAIRPKHQKEASKLFWRDSSHVIYQNAVDVAYLAEKEELAFQFCEKSRAVLLLDALQRKSKTNKDYHTNLVADLRAHLTADKAIVSYFIGVEYLYIFHITKQGLQVTRKDKPLDLEQDIQDFHRLSGEVIKGGLKRDSVQYVKQAHDLYQLLLEPVEPKKHTTLTIIPDGVLQTIPFEALVVSLPSKVNVPLDYVLNNTVVGYNNSAPIVLHYKGKVSRLHNVGLIAPQDFSFHGIDTLKYQEEEIEGIRRAMKGHKIQKFSADISKEELMKALEKTHYSILHFSTHASAKGGEPYIFLEREKLYLSEIEQLDLKADLVVLSACSTASGDLKKGEGVMSVARAFAYAGVPSFVTTLWDVNEKETGHFMGLFYDNLINKDTKMTKSKALHAAKTGYLRTCEIKTEIPYYWAGFILIGNDEAFK